MAIIVFSAFVLFVLGLSFYLGNKAKSASGYFAAGGEIHWAVNGISFAGDYLSAASFLGICGMIATMGYDGFLYSIGYLAGWIVALFVVAEPMKRLGKYTFTDALDAKFNSKGIQLAAAISTLVVSMCYLIPQMVGAGVLVTPLLGLEHYWGVIMVGAIVIFIVATAGMASTTYVQFLKGALLIIFSTILVICLCSRGLTTTPEDRKDASNPRPYTPPKVLATTVEGDSLVLKNPGSKKILAQTDHTQKGKDTVTFVAISEGTAPKTWWLKDTDKDDNVVLKETQWVTRSKGKRVVYNGDPTLGKHQLKPVGRLVQIDGKTGEEAKTGPLSPAGLIAKITSKDTLIERTLTAKITDGEDSVTIFYPTITPGNKLGRPGMKFKVEGTTTERINFVSLMLALFFGTAALPHILIRYYTVPSPACARKSTIVAIAAIGFFYILTLFMGLGAMASGVLNPADGNMSAPLLAQSFGTLLFAIISAIAFATVLGTVSGLIVAASGAVAHDLADRFAGIKMNDKQKVRIGKIAAVVVGLIAIALGILFEGMNVSFLVGWAFAVAASANLPAILMLLFWKKTTAKGIVASIIVGMVSAIGIIMLSPKMWAKCGATSTAPFNLDQPGIVSIPLSFITLVIVSLITQKDNKERAAAAES
jgi:cation/acetate symporter